MQYNSAVSFFNKALKINPNTAEAIIYKSIGLINDNKSVEAIKILKEFLQKDHSERTKSGYLILAMAYNKNKQSKEAIETLDEALMYYKNYVEALITKANLLVEEKMWIEAKKVFEAAIKLNKTIPTAYLGIGNCNYNLGNMKEADHAYFQAMHLGVVISSESKIIRE